MPQSTRREFVDRSLTAVAAVALPNLVPAADQPAKNDVSLAAWSLSRSFFSHHRWKNLDLPRICRQDLGINGLEFVNQFFENPTLRYLQELKKQADDYGVKLVLIMIDQEGDMAAVVAQERRQAAVAHRKWVDVAHYLGCHAVRCNLGGPRENWRQDADLVKRATESFRDLVEYAGESGLNVVIENHGRASSDPDTLVALMKAVNHPCFGTLPDFGNVNPGDDHAEVIRKIVPYAKGISVKARWTMDSRHPRYSLENLLTICQRAGYRGFWGIESGFDPGRTNRQGRADYSQLSADQVWENELQAIRRTKAVIERTVLGKA